MPSVDFSWEETDYGAFRSTGESHALIIFVHGIFGGSHSTWGELPRFLMEELAANFDVLSFEYPSKLWQEASIVRAAIDLQVALLQYNNYDQFIFVTHSTGGLVVKKMLLDDLIKTLRQLQDPAIDVDTIDSVSLRARRIINIAVPHNGGNKLLQGLGAVLYKVIFWPLFLPISKLGKSRGWGYNSIIEELRWANPMLVHLEQSYINLLKQYDEAGFARPIATEILARNDISVPKYSELIPQADASLTLRTDEHQLIFRGTHTSVKIPTRKKDKPIVGVLTKQIALFESAEDLSVATRSFRRTLTLEYDSIHEDAERSHVFRLMGSDSEINETADYRTLDFSVPFSQKTAYDSLWKLIHLGSEKPRRLVITGDAGVGKSFLLRRLTRFLSLEFLAGGNPARSLPLFFPLQQFKVEPAAVKLSDADLCEYLWNQIAAKWCQWANQLLQETAEKRGPGSRYAKVSSSWLEARLQNEPSTLIIDGIDEFLLDQGYLGVRDIGDLFAWLVDRWKGNRRLVVVAGVRSSMPNIEYLVPNRGDVLEIVRLTPDEAERHFPGARQVLNSLPDSDARNLLLTPLILDQLRTRLVRLPQTSLRSREDIYSMAIDAIVERIGRDVNIHGITHANDWVNGLMFVAWRFFRKFRGQATKEELLRECVEDHLSWRKHIKNTHLQEAARAVLRGSELASEHASLDAMLSRTVFVPTGGGGWRFMHREWEDFLVAKYLATVVFYQHAEELRHRAFTLPIYKSAAALLGKLLNDEELAEDRVIRVLQVTKELGDQFIVGNFAALTGDSTISISREASVLLLRSIKRFPSAARLTTLLDWGYRAIRHDTEDVSIRGVRDALCAVIRDHGFESDGDAGDSVIRSASWCYETALAAMGKMPPPAAPWPGLNDENDALNIVSLVTPQGGQLTPKHQSLQIGFLRIQHSVVEDPYRGIATLHFLYPIAVAYARGNSPRLVEVELPGMLSPNSVVEQAIKAFASKVTPELGDALCQIWNQCQRLAGSYAPAQFVRAGSTF